MQKLIQSHPFQDGRNGLLKMNWQKKRRRKENGPKKEKCIKDWKMGSLLMINLMPNQLQRSSKIEVRNRIIEVLAFGFRCSLMQFRLVLVEPHAIFAFAKNRLSFVGAASCNFASFWFSLMQFSPLVCRLLTRHSDL